jgi:hypothetical protein
MTTVSQITGVPGPLLNQGSPLGGRLADLMRIGPMTVRL